MSEVNSLFKLKSNKVEKITIVLADDHPLMRQALSMWIQKQHDLEVIAEASDGKEAVEIAARLHPNIVVMDILMPKLNGLEATKQIIERSSITKVLILSVYIDDEHILNALRAGASGYLAKDISGEEIIHAIRAIVSGEKVLPRTTSENIVVDALIPDTSKNTNILPLHRLDKLTPRDIEMLKLAAKGMHNEDIALRLGLSLRSIKANFSTIFLKLGVSSRTEAITVSLKNDIITLNDLNQ